MSGAACGPACGPARGVRCACADLPAALPLGVHCACAELPAPGWGGGSCLWSSLRLRSACCNPWPPDPELRSSQSHTTRGLRPKKPFGTQVSTQAPFPVETVSVEMGGSRVNALPPVR